MEIIETPYGNFNIYINTLISEQEILFHISFVDKNNQTHIVILRNESWKFEFEHKEKLPLWILSLKDRFIALIAKQGERNFQLP